MSLPPDTHLATRLIHAGAADPRLGNSVITPIFQSAMSTLPLPDGSPPSLEGMGYVRLHNTPNHLELHARLASLAGAEQAVVCASGMAAISASLLSVLNPGDHLLIGSQLYGGTHDWVHTVLAGLGIEATAIDPCDPTQWKDQLRANTRAVYVETLTNPLCQIPDLSAIVAFAREHQLVSMIDNTLASPWIFRPIEQGFDLSIHSATKYLNGHSDLLAGAVMGDAERVSAVSMQLTRMGSCLDPHACFLLTRGLKTLEVRMERQCATALALAIFLDAHPSVARVHHAGLKNHESYGRCCQYLRNGGALFSFELRGGEEAARTLVKSLRIPAHAPSLGGVESLVALPAFSSHAVLSPEDRAAAGIGPDLVRLSVGLEDVRDLQGDLAQAIGCADA